MRSHTQSIGRIQLISVICAAIVLRFLCRNDVVFIQIVACDELTEVSRVVFSRDAHRANMLCLPVMKLPKLFNTPAGSPTSCRQSDRQFKVAD